MTAHVTPAAQPQLDQPIQKLPVRSQLANVLLLAGFQTLGEVHRAICADGGASIRSLQNMGPKRWQELVELCEHLGPVPHFGGATDLARAKARLAAAEAELRAARKDIEILERLAPRS